MYVRWQFIDCLNSQIEALIVPDVTEAAQDSRTGSDSKLVEYQLPSTGLRINPGICPMRNDNDIAAWNKP